MMNVQPIVLQGSTVRLEPLDVRHALALARHADMGLFAYFPTLKPIEIGLEAMTTFIERALRMPNMLPFAIMSCEKDEAIGMTSYLDIRPDHLGLEIGFTWIGRAFQGTNVNPEAKLMMLRHAFEDLGCERVQLKTDARNLQSQAALRKLGATREGVLRKHMRMPDGYMRDTVMFSVIRDEWPAVEAALLLRLA